MSTTRFADHIIGPGTHASRPAANAVPAGTVYACTTHAKLEQSDGVSTWIDYFAGAASGGVATDPIWDAAGDIALGTGADTAARLPIGSSGKVLQSNGTTASWETPSAGATDGWTSTAVSLTYASADGPTGVATTGADLSGTIPLGARVKLTQTTVKYFIVTKIDATTITLYGGTDYTLANAAISAVSWSVAKVPFGFNPNPEKWTETWSDAVDRSQGSPTANTWYNVGSSLLAVPIGIWRIYYQVIVDNGTSAASSVKATLSTANNTESDVAMTSWMYPNSTRAILSMYREKTLVLTAKTTHYLNGATAAGGTFLDFRGAIGTTLIRAVCAYL